MLTTSSTVATSQASLSQTQAPSHGALGQGREFTVTETDYINARKALDKEMAKFRNFKLELLSMIGKRVDSPDDLEANSIKAALSVALRKGH